MKSEDHFIRTCIWVCQKPKMYVQKGDFETICAFIDGYDLAIDEKPLLRFSSWRQSESEQTNLAWWRIIRNRLFPGYAAANGPMDSEDGAKALEYLLSLLETPDE